tara:strand:- start:290 stop:487 length:198 start_codon:yes stop_codon:yes gene_type:complete
MEEKNLFLNVLQLIDIATKRGAWDGSELKSIGIIRETVVEKIKSFEDTENENLETALDDENEGEE